MNHTHPPRQSRTERKKEQTRRKIIAVAIELFQQQGIDATSMEHIAETADIAKGTLYNYYPVKEAILSDTIQQAFNQKQADRLKSLQNLPDTRSRLTAIFRELLKGVLAQREIFDRFLIYRVQNILSLHKTEAEKSGIESLASEIIQWGQQSGEIRTDLPTGILTDQFEFIFIEIVKQCSMDQPDFNTDQVIEAAIDLFINGIKPTTKSEASNS